jgi:hypothetical protein
VRLRLRPIIQTQDSLHRAGQFRRKTNAAFAHAIGLSVEHLLRQGDAKGLLHGSDGSGQLDGAPLGLGRVFLDREPEFFCEGTHQFDGRGIRSVLLPVLSACEPVFAQAPGVQWTLAFDDHRDSDRTFGECRLLRGCGGQGRFLTPRQHNPLLGREVGGGFLRSHGEFSESLSSSEIHPPHTIPQCVPKEVTSSLAGCRMKGSNAHIY